MLTFLEDENEKKFYIFILLFDTIVEKVRAPKLY